ncbi:MAG: hypothetical protein EXS50_03260 [Candidatus Taylorbacteria bacterium]|nr:hypothetical protein [Candidatus Taylorbacteria bacterium]
MSKVILDVKPFQETLHADMCGPASLKIILHYYGIEKSETELAKLTHLVPGLGIDDTSIVDAARTLGFKAEIKNESDFSDIEKWLKRGVPLIIDWFTRGRNDYSDNEVADGHYSVVYGIDDIYVYIQDPETGSVRKIGKEDFMKVWFDFLGKVIKPNELVIRQIIAIYK